MNRRTRFGGSIEWVVTVVLALALALVIRTFLVESFQVRGFSMQPTLFTGYRVLVDRLAGHLFPLKTGQIVVFHSPVPEKSRQDWIKRVIGVPGDTVSIRHNKVYINGHLYPEPFLKYRSSPNIGPVHVPKGYLWVLGDNRPDSWDSRYFGLLPMKNVIGQAMVVWWPLSAVKWLQ